MLAVPFIIESLAEYQKDIIRYTGLDMSFLNTKTDYFIDRWTNPLVTKIVDDRKLTVTYLVSSNFMAQNIADAAYCSDNSYMKFPNTDIKVKLICENVSWDVFTNRIEVNVVFILPSTVTEGEESEDTLNKRLVVANGFFYTPIYWRCYFNGVIKDVALKWEMKNVKEEIIEQGGLRIIVPNGGSGYIDIDTKKLSNKLFMTPDGRQNYSLAEAINNKWVMSLGELVPDPSRYDNVHFVDFSVVTKDNAVQKVWVIPLTRILI